VAVVVESHDKVVEIHQNRLKGLDERHSKDHVKAIKGNGVSVDGEYVLTDFDLNISS
jgi:hypothetical protein